MKTKIIKLNYFSLISGLFLFIITFYSCSPEEIDTDNYAVIGSITFTDELLDENGNPVEGALVSIWANDTKYTDITNSSGRYRIVIPQEYFPTSGQIAGSITKDGYRPKVMTYDSPLSDTTRYEIERPMIECPNCVLLIGNESALWHIGDDNYAGSVNSQFQKASDAPDVIGFNIGQTPSTSQIRVVFLAKGIQDSDCRIYYGNNSYYNLTPSASNGDYSFYSYTFNTNQNAEFIALVTAANSSGDKDDWEFVGLHVEAL